MFKAFEGRYGLSAYAVVFSSIIIILIGTLFYPKYNKTGTEATISWDVSGYYTYLPAKYIYHDLDKLEWMPELRQKYGFTPYDDLSIPLDSGNKVLKYSAGMAVLYSPAFFTAHVLSPIFGYEQDGYSYLYQLMLTLQGFFVSIIGLVFLRKILIRYFGDAASCLTILIITLGTNFLEYASVTNAMSHNYLFALYALLIYYSIKFHESPMYKNSVKIGIIIGLMALVRPTEIIAFLIPVLWHLGLKVPNIKARMFFLRDQWGKILIAALIIALIGSIQLFYWKSVSGSFVFYSYGDQGFSWLHPHIKDGLISYRAGWLIYTPVMLLSLIGFYSLNKKTPQLLFPTLVYFLIFIYVTFSWDIWWYGGSLGQRSMIQIYPLLAFPICALLERVSTSLWKTGLTYLFLIFGVYMNYWLIYQAHEGGLIRPGDMNKNYYLSIAGRFEKPVDLEKRMDVKFVYDQEIKNGTLVLDENFDDKCLTQENQFSQTWSIPIENKQTRFLRFQVECKSDKVERDVWKMTQMILAYYKGDKKVKDTYLRLQRVLPAGQWSQIYLDSKFNFEFDRVELSLWHGGSTSTLCYKSIKLLQHEGK